MEGIIGKITLGIIRHMVSGMAAGMVTKGLMDQSTSAQAVGALMFLITVGFSVYDKVNAGQKLAGAQASADSAHYGGN